MMTAWGPEGQGGWPRSHSRLRSGYNYHHLAASRAASVDDDEEEEDRLHAMLSMICSRNLTAPSPMKGFYPSPSP